jgi:hypothetical protein
MDQFVFFAFLDVTTQTTSCRRDVYVGLSKREKGMEILGAMLEEAC